MAAVTCDGRTLTRAELDATTNRLARAYQELGVGVGDYVTIVLPNSIEWIAATIACWKLGAVPQLGERPHPIFPHARASRRDHETQNFVSEMARRYDGHHRAAVKRY